MNDANESKGWHSRGYLPHLDAEGLTQHLTFHLADSLPRAALERCLAESASLPSGIRERSRRKRMHELLDAGIGTCLLRQPACATITRDALRFGDGERYRLLAWVVMPNHVHALIETRPSWPTGKVVQTWKRHTTKAFDTVANSASKPYWQRDYWDRFVRDQAQLEAVIAYIEQNPVRAGLVDRAEAWPWSSATKP